MIEGPVADFIEAGNMGAAQMQLDKMLREEAEDAQSSDQDNGQGMVYLVGFGPGDPDLLTFRALRLMQKADVIVMDDKAPPAVMELVRRDADRIFVNTENRTPETIRQEIEDHLITLATEGKRVLWLQQGNPLDPAQESKETAALKAHGIPFQIVPGISG